MIPVYEGVLFYAFQHVIDKSKKDYFYFVSHKKHYALYIKLRTVCKLWNEMILMKLPRRKHIKISPHNETDFVRRMNQLGSSNLCAHATAPNPPLRKHKITMPPYISKVT
jgi:hypothetical protein